MSTRELIDAIDSGDSVAIQTAFESSMMDRIAERMEQMRQEVAKNMFNEARKCTSKMSEEEDGEEDELEEDLAKRV
jgi:hypothetical protein